MKIDLVCSMSVLCTVSDILSLVYKLGDHVTANDFEQYFRSNVTLVEIIVNSFVYRL